MRKTALFLVFVMLMSLFALPMGATAASSLNPYAGFSTASFDEVSGTPKSTSGKVATMGKMTLTYKNIDFGASSPESVTLEIANDPSYTDQVVELYVDKVGGNPFATFTVKTGTGWSNITTFKSNIKVDISGVHTVYLVTAAKAADYYNMAFRMALTGDAVYKEYNQDNNVYSDIKDSPYRREINMMHDLGLMLKKEGEKFYPGHPVKRGDFANIIHNMMQNISVSDAKEIVFPDVPEKSEYFESVSFASSMGYISGYPDGTFRPDNFIQVSEATKILCKILGYEYYAEDKGGFESGYLTIAERFGLFEGIDKTAVLTNESMACLIYNAVRADFYEPNRFSDDGVGYVKNEDGILSTTMNVYREEGVISANNITSLAVSETKFDKNHVSINGENYIVGDSDARVLLGYECEVFYRKDGENRTILAIAPMENVEVTELNSRDDDITYIGTDKITYFKNTGSEKEIKMEKPYIIYNGMSIDKKLSELVTADTFRGKLKYVENSGDVNVLFIENYVNIEVGGINIAERTIYDNISQKSYKYPEDNDYVYFEKQGEPIPISDVVVGDVAMVYEGKDKNGRRFARFVLSNDVVSGTVSTIMDGAAVIDGIDYEIAPECDETITAGKQGNFKVNAYREIVTLSDSANTSRKTSWLMETGISGARTMSQEILIKVLDEDNVVREYSMADKGYLDGIKYEDGEVAITDAMLNNPIGYILDAEGKVRQLDTVVSNETGETDEKNEKDCLEYVDGYTDPNNTASSVKYWDWNATGRTLTSTGKGTPVNDYILAKDAKILLQPRGAVSAEDYKWTTSLGSQVEWALIYSFDKDSGYADILVKTNSAGDKTSSYVVSEVIETLDSEGDPRTALVLLTANDEVTYYISDRNPADMEVVKALSCGDYIRGNVFGGDIRNIEIIRLANNEKELTYGADQKLEAVIHKESDNQGKITSGSTAERYVLGRVIERDGDYVRIERMTSGYKEFVYLGGINGMEYTKTSRGNISVENNVSKSNIGNNDVVLFVFVNTGTKVFYIVDKADDDI